MNEVGSAAANTLSLVSVLLDNHHWGILETLLTAVGPGATLHDPSGPNPIMLISAPLTSPEEVVHRAPLLQGVMKRWRVVDDGDPSITCVTGVILLSNVSAGRSFFGTPTPTALIVIRRLTWWVVGSTFPSMVAAIIQHVLPMGAGVGPHIPPTSPPPEGVGRGDERRFHAIRSLLWDDLPRPSPGEDPAGYVKHFPATVFRVFVQYLDDRLGSRKVPPLGEKLESGTIHGELALRLIQVESGRRFPVPGGGAAPPPVVVVWSDDRRSLRRGHLETLARHLPPDGLLLLPLNDGGGVHWSLLTLSEGGRRVHLNDSLSHPLHLPLVRELVREETPVTIVLPDPGQTQRGEECGVYLLTAALQKMIGRPLGGKISAAAVRAYQKGMEEGFSESAPGDYQYILNLVRVAWITLIADRGDG